MLGYYVKLKTNDLITCIVLYDSNNRNLKLLLSKKYNVKIYFLIKIFYY